MDPFVWGPLTWNLIFDIAWRLDHLHSSKHHLHEHKELELHHSVRIFFQLLTKLLPCPECCCSYKEFIQRLEIPRKEEDQYMNWAYHMKDFVNQKLQRSSPSLEEVVRRMQTVSSLCSLNSIWDWLFIIGMNYSKSNRKFIQILLDPKVLPEILGRLRISIPIAKRLKQKPIDPNVDLKSKRAFLYYLCRLAKRNIHQVKKQYQNCASTRKPKNPKEILLSVSQLKLIRNQLQNSRCKECKL